MGKDWRDEGVEALKGSTCSCRPRHPLHNNVKVPGQRFDAHLAQAENLQALCSWL